MEGPDFLKQKYNLHNTPEVESSAKRTEIRTGEDVSQNPSDRIQNYLDRFKEILDREDQDKRERGMEALKRVLLDKFVTKTEDIPESYWKSQENILRERGQKADYDNFSEEQKTKWKKEISEGLLDDQKASLEQWVDYFASSDSSYLPDYLKYWVFRSVTGLAEYDKEKKEFSKRSKGTIKQFPDINREALAYVVDAVIKKHKGEGVKFEYDIQPEERQTFVKSLEKENFAKLYAWANDLMNPIPEHLLPVTDGEWRKYKKDSDSDVLVQSIRGRGTGWCTAGMNTAKTQLKGGDFYCYYSLDDEGNPAIPRLAIRMEGDKIAEVRGVAYTQNVDPYMPDILEKKLNEFPDKAQYLKKDRDMKRLTEIDNKTKENKPLTKDELVFLYEISESIEGFGYEKDQRIQELRSTRNPEEDMQTVFECTPEQIAHTGSEITPNTKAYVGPIEKGIFQKLPENLEHIYTSFPEGKIKKYHTEIGGKTKAELKQELAYKKIYVSDWANQLLESKDFTVLESTETTDMVRLTVKDLGFPSGATTDEIYTKAKELGLELCPAEVGPHLRLSYSGNDWMYIAMKQITDRDGNPNVFNLNRDEAELKLNANYAGPTSRWSSDVRFVFLLRKRNLDTEKL